MRKAVSFTLDSDVLSFVRRTRGRHSASERANELMRRAMIQEMYDRIGREAAAFFAEPISDEERKETRAFFRASLKSVGRD